MEHLVLVIAVQLELTILKVGNAKQRTELVLDNFRHLDVITSQPDALMHFKVNGWVVLHKGHFIWTLKHQDELQVIMGPFATDDVMLGIQNDIGCQVLNDVAVRLKFLFNTLILFVKLKFVHHDDLFTSLSVELLWAYNAFATRFRMYWVFIDCL